MAALADAIQLGAATPGRIARLIRLQLKHGNLSEALAAARRLNQAFPDMPEFVFLEARCRMALRKGLDQARQSLESLALLDRPLVGAIALWTIYVFRPARRPSGV